jgi:protein O-GlcNAc transferase
MLRKLFGRWLYPAPDRGIAEPRGAAASRPVDAANRLIAAGRSAEDAGRLAEACERYREALSAAPDYLPAHFNLGVALAAAGDARGAEAAYRAVLAIDAGHAYANYNLAALLYARGDSLPCESLLRAAIEREPEFPEALVALSNLLLASGKTEAAAEALAAALRARPDYPGALLNYGMVLRELKRFSEAEGALRRAVELDPANASAYEALTLVLRDQARMDEALETLRSARKLAPEPLHLESNELLMLNFQDDVTAEELFARHRDFGVRLERAVPARFDSFLGERDGERRLRIGYLSGDFRTHPVSLFMIPLLTHHDRNAYEIHCYSTNAQSDAITARVRALADHWLDAASLSDTELADVIHRDGIDILVDLSGHTGVYRMGVFAQRPAPVQVSWLGYLNTTGLTRIQYRLCDARTDPPGVADALHTEELVRLPFSQWCYRPLALIEPAPCAPFESNGFLTFGSFNVAAKVSPAVCKLWGEILRSVPESRLLMGGVPAGVIRERLLAAVVGTGVAPERITFAPRVPVEEYYRLYDTVDIALDTMPYGGGTTTLDALWMGVPVVTAPGRTPVSRSAASILEALELRAWVAAGPRDYVRLAVEHALAPSEVSALRRNLRQRMLASPLTDEARFARDLESAYRSMWRRWCNDAARS